MTGARIRFEAPSHCGFTNSVKNVENEDVFNSVNDGAASWVGTATPARERTLAAQYLSRVSESWRIAAGRYRAWRTAMLRPLGVARRAIRGDDLRPGSEIALPWFWVVAWIVVVQIFASGSFSASETSRFITPLLRWLFPDVDAESVATAHFAVRKLGHFVEYAILALLALRAFDSSLDRPLAWLAAASLGLALAVAVVDEVRQAAAANRTGALSDVALDLAGAASALALAGAARRRWSSRT
jgi:VanZ family protein